MSKTYSTNLDLPKIDIALLVLRIGIAGLMLTHGIPKLIKLFTAEEIQFGDPLGVGPVASLTLTVFGEAICSVLVALGLATRLAAIPPAITMAVAAFIVHADDPFATKEKAILYLLVFVFFIITGAGKYSLDHYFLKAKKFGKNNRKSLQ